ncbi:MAG: phage/plasmid primase, P4 family [Pirellulaceae bacterium]
MKSVQAGGTVAGVGYAPQEDDGFLFLDLDDCRDPATGQLSPAAADLVARCGTYTEITPSGKGLRIIGLAEGYEGKGKRTYHWPDGALKGEVYKSRGYVTVTFNRLTGVPGAQDQVLQPIGAVANEILARSVGRGRDGEGNGGSGQADPLRERTAPLAVVAETLNAIPNDKHTDWDAWKKIAMAIYAATEGGVDAFEAFEAWSMQNPGHVPGSCEVCWEEIENSPPDDLGYGTLHFQAKRAQAARGIEWKGGPVWQAWNAERYAIPDYDGPLPSRKELIAAMRAVPIPRMEAEVRKAITGAIRAIGVDDAADIMAMNRVGVGVGSDGADPDTGMDMTGCEFTEGQLGRMYVKRHLPVLRHAPGMGQWFVWSGTAWEVDNRGWHKYCAYNMCETLSDELLRIGDRTLMKTAQRLGQQWTGIAAMRIAAVNPSMVVQPADLDSDPWLLNTPLGIVNLRTAELLPHDPARLMTKITAVGPDFLAECPQWRAFLSDCTGADIEMQTYLQKLAGYCLTGETREQSLFFLYGPGGNGKSVLLNILQYILRTGHDGYCRVTGPETWTVLGQPRHLAELARLHGARLVLSSETERGHRWAETRIKQITGGDEITANLMRQNPFSFRPVCKLVIAGNHMPQLADVTPAMVRRFKVLPFLHKPPVVDPNLEEKLRAEAPAILAWAVRGAVMWQAEGLGTPAAVRAASEEYLESEDVRSQWFRECFEDVRQQVGSAPPPIRSNDLFQSWKIWAERHGEYVGSQKALTEWLKQRQFRKVRNGANQICFLGIRPRV